MSALKNLSSTIFLFVASSAAFGYSGRSTVNSIGSNMPLYSFIVTKRLARTCHSEGFSTGVVAIFLSTISTGMISCNILSSNTVCLKFVTQQKSMRKYLASQSICRTELMLSLQALSLRQSLLLIRLRYPDSLLGWFWLQLWTRTSLWYFVFFFNRLCFGLAPIISPALTLYCQPQRP